MGGAFARNLVKSGWHVVGYDVDPAPPPRHGARRRRDRGRRRGARRRGAGHITSLPKPDALEATAKAIVAARVRPLVIVEASTFTIADKLKASARAQGRPRDAGLPDQAAPARRPRPRTRGLCQRATARRSASSSRCSPASPGPRTTSARSGNGSRMKYVANLLVAINNVASAEAMVLGIKAGLDPQTVFGDGCLRCRQFARVRAARALMVKDRYDDVTMKIAVWQKDMAVIGQFAREIGSADADVRRQRAGLRQGDEERPCEQDTAAVCAVLEAMAGVSARRGRGRQPPLELIRKGLPGLDPGLDPGRVPVFGKRSCSGKKTRD